LKIENVYILGGYQTDFARNWARENKHISAMMREAYEGSLMTTKIQPKDIKAAFIGNFAAELYCMQGHLGAFFVDFDPAFKGLPTSRFDIAMVGVELMKSASPAKGGDYLGTAAWYERESAGVEFPFPKLFGRLGDVYADRYGLDDSHLAQISAVNYANARKNPNAQTREWFMSYDHACSSGQYNTTVSGRIKATDCSQITDGAVCLYLASEQKATDYAARCGLKLKDIPHIAGWGHTTAPIEFTAKVKDSENSDFVLPWTRKAITDAYGRAGIADCWALDAIETHDCFTTSEYMAIDHFGLTAPGQSYKAIEDGIIELDGKLPINPSGGLIGCGHPVGATGARQLLDAYKQVTGTAGDYQVKDAKRVATLNIGGSATTNVCCVIEK
jgi:acetyl-CoA C-acetyltransferase